MASVNRVILIGNLGKDPESRYMSNGEAVTNITLATTDTWKDKNGEKQEKTEWHRVTFYRKLAEIAGEYLKKSSLVYIEGRLETRKWTDKQGIEKYTTEIIASDMQMLGIYFILLIIFSSRLCRRACAERVIRAKLLMSLLCLFPSI